MEPLLSHARFEAENADHLVRQLCISFVNLATSHSGGRGQNRFSFGWCQVEAFDTILQVTSGAENVTDLERVDEIVIDRLKRIAHHRRQGLEVLQFLPCCRHNSASMSSARPTWS